MGVRTPLLVLSLSVMALSGCHDDSRGPNLLVVNGLSPARLGPADQLEIAGSGFPPSRAVDVVFRGDLHRPGREVERDVEIVARTQTSTSRSLSVAMTKELQSAFTGPDGEGLHTTFRGEVVVSYSPPKAGMAIRGTLSDVVLDVSAPLLPPVLQRQRDLQTKEALGFLGITLGESGCCVVAAAVGRAAAAGIKAGDQLVSMEGVSVQEPGDLIPQGRTRSAQLTLRENADGPVVRRDVDVQGFRHAAPSELRMAVLLVLGMATAVWLMYGPGNTLLSWVVRLLAERKPAWSGRLPSAAWLRHKGRSTLGRITTNEVPEHAMARLFGVLCFVGMAVLTTLLSLRVELVARELDVPLLSLFTATLSILCASIHVTSHGGWRSLGVVKGLLSTVIFQLPLLCLVVMVGLTVGTLSAGELMGAQTPWPHGWLAFHDPGLMLLGLLAFVSLIPTVTGVGPVTRQSAGKVGGSTLLLLQSVEDWVKVLIIVVATLGGSRLPFVSASDQFGTLGWQLVGAGLLQLKCLLAMGLLSAMRSLLGGVTIEEAYPLMLRHGMVTLVLAVAGNELWSFATARWSLGWLETVVRTVLLGSLVLAVGWVLARGVSRPPSTEPKGGLKAWL